MDFKAYLKTQKELVDRALREYFPPAQGPAASVVQAMQYSLFAGGKRLRPILCLAGAEAVGGHGPQVLPMACAFELIHTYSLIHDDLPVMDNDDLRRGRPTNHKVFGEAMALLAGDGLLTEAFRLIAAMPLPEHLQARTLLKAMALIAEAAGYQGMVGGQAVDIESTGKAAVDPGLLEFIHTHKTGALITASVTSGALISGAEESRIDALTLYGRAIGLAFQIADDILDIEGDSKEMGKGVGGDARKKKITYPAVIGLDRAKQMKNETIQQAMTALTIFDHRAEPLRLLANYISERKK